MSLASTLLEGYKEDVLDYEDQVNDQNKTISDLTTIIKYLKSDEAYKKISSRYSGNDADQKIRNYINFVTKIVNNVTSAERFYQQCFHRMLKVRNFLVLKYSDAINNS